METLQTSEALLKELVAQQEVLRNWAIAIGGVLCTVIGSLWVKWQSDVKEYNKEIIRLNTELLNAQKEHSRELREMFAKTSIIIEKATEIMKQNEYNKRG